MTHAAVIDAAGERKFAGNAISACNRRHPTERLDRSRDRDIKPVCPDRLLRLLRKLAEIMRVMNHQAGAPAVRRVGLGDLAHHLEPGVEAEAVTAEPRRDKNAGNAGAEKSIDRFPRQRARFLRRGGAVAKAGSQFAHTRQYCLVGITRWCLAVVHHHVPAALDCVNGIFVPENLSGAASSESTFLSIKAKRRIRNSSVMSRRCNSLRHRAREPIVSVAAGDESIARKLK